MSTFFLFSFFLFAQESSKDRVLEVEEKRPAEVLTLDVIKGEGRDGGDSNLGNSLSNEDLSRPSERPKLNLKPRSQPAEPGVDLDGNVRYVLGCIFFSSQMFTKPLNELVNRFSMSSLIIVFIPFCRVYLLGCRSSTRVF